MIKRFKQTLKLTILIIPLTLFYTAASANSGIGSASQSEAWIFRNDTTKSGSGPYYKCYRIPAIVKLPNNELLAFAEGRRYTCSDHDKNIDIVMRRRDANGHWGPITKVANHGGRVTRNPSPVVDKNGTIHLLYNVSYNYNDLSDQSNVAESKIVADNKGPISEGKTDYRSAVFYIRSSDGGHTWDDASSTPINIDADVHPNAGDRSYDNGLWSWYAITPGHAIELKSGKLFFAANHHESRHALSSGPIYRSYAHGIIFDPQTQSFSLSKTVGADTSESTAAQLDNGWIYMNMRNNHRSVGKVRAISLSKNEGREWMGPRFDHRPTSSANYWRNIGYDKKLVSPKVQGSVLRYSSDKQKTAVSRLLFSNPADTDFRNKGTIRVSYDEGVTWPFSYKYDSGNELFASVAYSDLVITGEKNVGILYETSEYWFYNEDNPKSGIYYIEANLEKITAGRDAHIKTSLKRNFKRGLSKPNKATITSKSQYDPNTADLTILTTFTLSEQSNLNNTQMIARKGNLYSSHQGWAIFIEKGKIVFRANVSNGIFGKIGVSGNIGHLLDDRNVKHTVAVRFKRKPSTMDIYIDGKKIRTSLMYRRLQDHHNVFSYEPIVLAGLDRKSPLKGTVYEFSIYPYALKNETIAVYTESGRKNYNFSRHFKQDYNAFWPRY